MVRRIVIGCALLNGLTGELWGEDVSSKAVELGQTYRTLISEEMRHYNKEAFLEDVMKLGHELYGVRVNAERDLASKAPWVPEECMLEILESTEDLEVFHRVYRVWQKVEYRIETETGGKRQFEKFFQQALRHAKNEDLDAFEVAVKAALRTLKLLRALYPKGTRLKDWARLHFKLLNGVFKQCQSRLVDGPAASYWRDWVRKACDSTLKHHVKDGSKDFINAAVLDKDTRDEVQKMRDLAREPIYQGSIW